MYLKVEIQQVLVNDTLCPICRGSCFVIASQRHRSFGADLGDLARNKFSARFVGTAHFAGHIALRRGAASLDLVCLRIFDLGTSDAAATEH